MGGQTGGNSVSFSGEPLSYYVQSFERQVRTRGATPPADLYRSAYANGAGVGNGTRDSLHARGLGSAAGAASATRAAARRCAQA